METSTPLRRNRRRWVLLAMVVLAYPLWYIAAYPRGMVTAWIDLARDRLAVKSYGLRMPGSQDYSRLLKERYGVHEDVVGACVVSLETSWYANGYNDVSLPAIHRRFGKDVFVEAAEMWLAQQKKK